MTDEVTPQTQPTAPKKDEKKPAANGSTQGQGAGRNPRRNMSRSGSVGTPNKDGPSRPSSGASNKRNQSKPRTVNDNTNAEPRKGDDGRKQEQRGGKPQAGGNPRHRKGSSAARQGAHASKDLSRQNSGGKQSSSPAPVAPAPTAAVEGSDALSSLQRVIADLKTSSPSVQSASMSNPLAAPVPIPASQSTSNLPANAPVFHPGAIAFPGSAPSEQAPRHRKAASLGAGSLPNSFNTFSNGLGSMMEDVIEEGPGGSFEEGEIPDASFQHGAHQRRSLSQSFTAPRFAALAAQQEQGDNLGASGRPQLAPGFMFGGRRRPSAQMQMGPPINEEDIGFQFPQQLQQKFNNIESELTHRKESSGEISGIMAEQIAIQTQIEALQQQQQALYQQQLASNQVLSFQTPGLAPPRAAAHRRVHSTLPLGMGMSAFAGPQSAMGQFGQIGNLGMGMDGQSQGVPRGHGRRHSVNVLNKTSSQPGVGFEGFDDGFMPPPGINPAAGGPQHNRSESAWRINGGVGAVQPNNGFASDLAQAQAQLQSLQQFRAAAGGHHHKLPSFSFPNMLPNMMAANMMGLGLGGVSLLQSQQQFHQQLQQQSNQPQRKSLFAPYLPQASLPPLLAAGKLVVGILRVNKRNRSDAYVATEVLDADIYICGSKDRNRALEGDIVAVELLDVDEVWGTKKEKEEKKRKKEENSAYDLRGVAGRKNDKKKDDVEVEGQGLMLFEDEEVTDEVKPQFAGHVVAVVERMPGQLFSGTLGLLRPSSAATKEKQEAERREREGDRGDEPRRPIERPKIVWFKPTDKRVPLIAIPTEQAPPDFVQNSESYANKLFVACIKRHPISSLHPFGTLVEELGPIGDVEVETSALLKDCNFPTEDFTDNVLKCLPPMPWTIPEREFEVRKDLRSERVFTIDPEGAKDVDDAVSIKINEDGTYDVSVHIADVSHFVKPNTALDRDARKRATSVYLVQRAVSMLPPALSEQLCSLTRGQERLAFSVVFTMTKEAKIVKKWFGRTIIKPAAQLTYGNAQAVIDGKSLEAPITPEHNAADIENDIKILDGLARQLRERRFEAGALKGKPTELAFKLDQDGMPVDCGSYDRTEANNLIEEFMLLTNVAVAQQVAVHFPEQALLRRHDNPIDRRMFAFAERVERLGYKLDTTSSGALMRSIDAITDPAARQIVDILLSKATQRAKYFCAGMLDIAKYNHYALNVPVYTHFTSPIRRYADILVHRQLDAILQTPTGTEPKFTMDRDAVAKVAQQCNIKQDSAKLAQEQSAHLYLCILIADLTQRYGPVVRQAKVVGVLDAAFDVYVPEFGIEKRVHVDQMPIENHVYDEHKHTLQIYWSVRDVITWLVENSDDEHLRKVKQNAEQHAVKMEVASRSVNDEQALFDEDDTEEDEIVLGRDTESNVPETSKQRLLSKAKVQPVFEGLKTTAAGHRIQEIREMQTVPVIVTADLTKSPPVIKVYSVNPYSSEK